MQVSKAKITYCGHSTVVLTTEGGKVCMIDPYLEGNPSCPEVLHNPKQLDYIFLTHGHSDHSSSCVRLAKQYGATIFATFELAVLLGKDGVPQEQLNFMNKGGRVEIPGGNGLALTLTHAFHSSSYEASDGQTYYAGEPCGVLVELESGRTLYHAGDTALFDDMKRIGQKRKPAVALLPIGDRFTMGPEDAAEAAKLIEPEIAIPVHHSTWPMLTGKPETFAELLQGTRTAVKILQPGEAFEF